MIRPPGSPPTPGSRRAPLRRPRTRSCIEGSFGDFCRSGSRTLASYRVFCVLDGRAPENGLDAKVLVLLSAAVKRVGSAMDRKAYEQALAYRADYLKTRRIALPADPSKRRSTDRPI